MKEIVFILEQQPLYPGILDFTFRPSLNRSSKLVEAFSAPSFTNSLIGFCLSSYSWGNIMPLCHEELLWSHHRVLGSFCWEFLFLFLFIPKEYLFSAQGGRSLDNPLLFSEHRYKSYERVSSNLIYWSVSPLWIYLRHSKTPGQMFLPHRYRFL